MINKLILKTILPHFQHFNIFCVFQHKNKCKKVCNVDIVAYLYFIFETNQILTKTCKNENIRKFKRKIKR